MSAEENKIIARRFVEEMMSGHHVERIDEFVSPDAVHHERGHDGSYAEALRSVFGHRTADWQFTVEDVIAEEDRVMVRCSASYTTWLEAGPLGIRYEPGTRATVEHVHVFRIRDGLIAEHWPVRDDWHGIQQFHEPVRERAPQESGT